MIFKTNYNIGHMVADGLTGNMEIAGSSDNPGYNSYDTPSDTIPGQAMSIQDMLKRIAAGLPLSGQKVPLYEGDENTDDEDLQGHPDLSKMDLVDREEYIELQQERLAKLKTKFANQKAYEEKIKADQGKKSERNKAQEDDQSDTDEQPRVPKGTEQYPKKTRGAGAAPRDEEKGGLNG